MPYFRLLENSAQLRTNTQVQIQFMNVKEMHRVLEQKHKSKIEESYCFYASVLISMSHASLNNHLISRLSTLIT